MRAALALALAGGAAAAAAEAQLGSRLSPDENACLMCHGEASLWEGELQRLHTSPESLADDVHFAAGVHCHDCHGGDPAALEPAKLHLPEDGFRPLEQVAAACGRCHADEAEAVRRGGHAAAGRGEPPGPLACTACHGPKVHGMRSVADPQSPVRLEHQVAGCGACHEEAAASYRRTVHGRGLVEAGLTSTAVCADCHDPHGALPASDPGSRLHRDRVAATCGACHRFIAERVEASVHGASGRPRRGGGTSGVRRRAALPSCTDCHGGHELADPDSLAYRNHGSERCQPCHQGEWETYRLSLHGKLSDWGYAPAARCADCHGGHDILPVGDPRSRVARGANRLTTCRRCHPQATLRFTSFHPHADPRRPGGQPWLYAVHWGMRALLYAVFGLFGAHAVVWVFRSAVHAARRGRPRGPRAGSAAYVRFTPVQRAFHALLVVTFLGLALTGLPLCYSGADWARRLADGMGGFVATSTLHHLFGGTMLLAFMGHLAWVGREAQRRRRAGRSWRQVLLGPDSLLPNRRDLGDAVRALRWFAGLGPKPTFERWTYWEKFDYWAVFWGVAIIGTSGLVLWFPETACRVLPGYMVNVAYVLHSEEALLAVGYIFAIHFTMTHLRPEKLPMDMSMLHGAVSQEELEAERPELLERLRAEGRLDLLQTAGPSRARRLALGLAGAAALAIGLTLLAVLVAT